jgi:hypothetical protein
MDADGEMIDEHSGTYIPLFLACSWKRWRAVDFTTRVVTYQSMQSQLEHTNVARTLAIPVVLNNLAGSNMSQNSHDRITSYRPVMNNPPFPIQIHPGKTKLPNDFEPNSYTVLCGRGKDHYNWIGNRRFRVLVSMNLDRYSYTRTKAEKTRIVMDVVEAIHECGGHFAKRKVNGEWYDVGYDAAREKVGALFRDMLQKRQCHSHSVVSSRSSPRASLAQQAPPEFQRVSAEQPTLSSNFKAERHDKVGGSQSDEQLDFDPEALFPF